MSDETETPAPEASPFGSADGATSTDSETTASAGTAASGSDPSPLDEEESSPNQDPSSDAPEAEQQAGGTIISTTPSDSTDSEPESASDESEGTDTPIFDSLGKDLPDSGQPSAGEQPEADLLTGGTYDGTPGQDNPGAAPNQPENPSDPAKDDDLGPTATGIADGKDGASPTENQGTIEELGGPGVDGNVSLSPNEDGVPEALANDDEPSTEPVITQPEDQTTADGLEPTFVTQPFIASGVSGRTPRFSAVKTGDVLSVRKVGWIGAETFDVHSDDVDELVGLLQELRDAE